MIPTIISEGKAFNKMRVVHNELYHHLLKNMWDLLEECLARFAPGEHSRRLFTTTAKTPAKKSCLRGFSHFRGAECKLIEIAIKNPNETYPVRRKHLGEKASTTLRHHQGGANVTNTCGRAFCLTDE